MIVHEAIKYEQITTLYPVDRRIEHRKWNRGRNGLHHLGAPIAPSILFPVFHPPYPQGSIYDRPIIHYDSIDEKGTEGKSYHHARNSLVIHDP